MTILEVNLEKPAIVEEHVVEGRPSTRPTPESGRSRRPLLVLLIGLVAVAYLGQKWRSRADTSQTASKAPRKIEIEEPETDGGRFARLLNVIVDVTG